MLEYSIFSIAAAAIGIGGIGMTAMHSIGRNPSAANDIKSAMLLPLVFCEFTALLMFVSIILLKP